jgi:hypothetical protein
MPFFIIFDTCERTTIVQITSSVIRSFVAVFCNIANLSTLRYYALLIVRSTSLISVRKLIQFGVHLKHLVVEEVQSRQILLLKIEEFEDADTSLIVNM